MDPKEAKKVYDAYMRGFSGVAKYQKYCRQAGLHQRLLAASADRSSGIFRRAERLPF